LAAHAARATWIGNFLAVGGIATLHSPPIHQSADVGTAFATSGASIACICGADDAYAELGDAAASALVTAGAREVAIAGRPRDLEMALKSAGVSRFIYAGCDMVSTLASLQRTLGVEGGCS
jgi:methylmalonyl-CoA mutase